MSDGSSRARAFCRGSHVQNRTLFAPLRADRSTSRRLDRQGHAQTGRPTSSRTRVSSTIWSEPHRRSRGGQGLARKGFGRSVSRPGYVYHRWNFLCHPPVPRPHGQDWTDRRIGLPGGGSRDSGAGNRCARGHASRRRKPGCDARSGRGNGCGAAGLRRIYRSGPGLSFGASRSGRESPDFDVNRFHRGPSARAADAYFPGRGRAGARPIPPQASARSCRAPRSHRSAGGDEGAFAPSPRRFAACSGRQRSSHVQIRYLGREQRMANLGFIGLGVMGGEMVNRLLAKGHSVTGYNRTRSKAEWLVRKGMKWGDSPRAVASATDVTFCMVTNSAALGAVADGPDGFLGGLRAGKLVVDMSTVSPAFSREIAAKVREKGADMVDSPVSGSVITLQEGKLSVMVAGRRETFERAKPLLLDIGPKVTYVGENGLALVMKIATNLSLAVQMLAFCEGVLLAEKGGIARATAVDVLTHSVIASPMVQYRGPFVLKMPEEAWFNVNMMQKDMLLALELGRQLDVPMPTTAVTNEFLTAARGMGLVEKDFAVVFDVLAQMSGVKA